MRGEEGREVDRALDLDLGRALGCASGDIGPVDSTGAGACICIDIARVGRGGNGTRPRLMEKVSGEARGDNLGGAR